MGMFSGLGKIVSSGIGAISGGAAGYLTGGWGGAAAGALSGFASSEGVRAENRANSAQALQQMQFQERMSSTAHQREVIDLRKAGLNPILSAGGGGASSPGGAMAIQKDIQTPAINTALVAAQIGKIKADTNLTTKQADAIEPASAVGQGVEYIKNLFKGSTAAELRRHQSRPYPTWMDKNKSKWSYPETYKHGSVHKNPTRKPQTGKIKRSKAKAYPLGSKPHLVIPRTNQVTKKYLNFKDYSIEYFTRLRNGVAEYKFKNTPWLPYSKIQGYTSNLKKGMN